MKILVLSDSHAGLQLMRRAIRAVRPDAVIHLGDYYDDAEVLAEENPGLTVHRVAGNCDRYRCPPSAREMLCYDVGGVRLFMTHGHNHRVKTGLYMLLLDARKMGAKAALYGHTHIPDCHMEEDGLWVLNPGSCGHSGGSVGLLETDGGQITACRLLFEGDLLEMEFDGGLFLARSEKLW